MGRQSRCSVQYVLISIHSSWISHLTCPHSAPHRLSATVLSPPSTRPRFPVADLQPQIRRKPNLCRYRHALRNWGRRRAAARSDAEGRRSDRTCPEAQRSDKHGKRSNPAIRNTRLIPPVSVVLRHPPGLHWWARVHDSASMTYIGQIMARAVFATSPSPNL